VKGDKEILKNLQNLLNYELAARDQYLAHSRKYQDWGLTKLHAQMDHEMQEEQQHIDAIMNRMLFLEGDPDFTQRENPVVGDDVETMLRNDLEAEVDVAQILRVTMQMCEEKNDYDTRDILQVLLHDTEMDHIYWLEQQLGLIEKIGLPNYLQNQM
jgi:bacterioferritin